MWFQDAKSFVLSMDMINLCFPTYLATIRCIIDSKEKHSMFFILHLYKNIHSMAAILDFTMAAKDTILKMCPEQLLT